MENIQMVDLKNQYHKIKKEVDQKIEEVIASSAFIKGEAVDEFQKQLEEYLKVKHVIPCGNGTDALLAAFMALNLQPGDEVITTPFTFIATAEVAMLLQLKVVFVDVEPTTFNMNANLIEEKITSKTKAIIPVHLFGQCCNMEMIMALAEKYDIAVIEDACQSIGAQYRFSDGVVKQSGTIGKIGCTSFFPSKNLGCFGDGGAIFTNDDLLAKELRAITNHGMSKRYHHDRVGMNSRLDSIQAAVLSVKLKYLDDYLDARRNAAAMYQMFLSDNMKITTPSNSPCSTHVYHQYTLKLHDVDRDKLRDTLSEKGIPTMVYYPIPLHLQKVFSSCGWQTGDFPITESLSNSVLSLPMHTELTREQIQYICETLLNEIS
jgi:dTDP-4-amino-4,6-dideoxygalactose transaminase